VLKQQDKRQAGVMQSMEARKHSLQHPPSGVQSIAPGQQRMQQDVWQVGGHQGQPRKPSAQPYLARACIT
jgi:hypothetical protein